MENLSISRSKSSLYCWIILTVFIALTLIFMINFYNKAITEISNNARLNNIQVISSELDNYDKK